MEKSQIFRDPRERLLTVFTGSLKKKKFKKKNLADGMP